MNKQDFMVHLRSPESKKFIVDCIEEERKNKKSKENANSKEAAKRETRKK